MLSNHLDRPNRRNRHGGRRRTPALTLAAVFALAPSAQAQTITAQDALDAWDSFTTMVVESAKRMPAEHFGYTPTEPLRNFADQLNHTTMSNFGFSYAVGAGEPTIPLPDRSNPPQDKASVIRYLEASFAHMRSGLAGLTDADLAEAVPWGPASNRRQITRLKAILIITGHLQSEHGKTMIYLREKGITPAPAGGWN